MAMNYAELYRIANRLKNKGFILEHEGIARNIKAQTRYPQYIIYLSKDYVTIPEEEVIEAIEFLCPEFSIESVKTMPFRQDGKVTEELWIFVKEKEQDSAS